MPRATNVYIFSKFSIFTLNDVKVMSNLNIKIKKSQTEVYTTPTPSTFSFNVAKKSLKGLAILYALKFFKVFEKIQTAF